MEASTPRLCNSSTTRYRHWRPNPLFARYQPPPRIARIVTRSSSRPRFTATRCTQTDREPRRGVEVNVDGSWRTVGLMLDPNYRDYGQIRPKIVEALSSARVINCR